MVKTPLVARYADHNYFRFNLTVFNRYWSEATAEIRNPVPCAVHKYAHNRSCVTEDWIPCYVEGAWVWRLGHLLHKLPISAWATEEELFWTFPTHCIGHSCCSRKFSQSATAEERSSTLILNNNKNPYAFAFRLMTLMPLWTKLQWHYKHHSSTCYAHILRSIIHA